MSIIVFAVLFANSLGFNVKYELFKIHSAYVRNSLVWASQGIYSKYEYLERIFFDAMLDNHTHSNTNESRDDNYEMIGDYRVKNDIERPHEYVDDI